MDRPVDGPASAARRMVVLVGAGAAAVVLVVLALVALRRVSSVDRSIDGGRVSTAVVKRGDLVRDAQADGKVVAALHPTFFAATAGIVRLRARAGEAVKKGELLATIDSPELVSRLGQERSSLQSVESDLGRQRIASRQTAAKNQQAIDLAEVRLQAAKRLLERAQRTFDEGLLNKTDFEKARDDVAIAALELKIAKETADLAKETADFEVKTEELKVDRQRSVVAELSRQVEQLSIRAPFDGNVSNVAVQDRDAVPANAPVLTVVSLERFEVEFSLPESYASEAVPGTPATVVVEGREVAAKVRAVSAEVKDAQVKGTLDFEGGMPPALRQGQRVSVRLLFETRPGVLKVARGPFLESGGGRIAWVVVDGIASKRDVEIGARSVSEVEIVKGLSEGDVVVVSDMSEVAGTNRVLLRK